MKEKSPGIVAIIQARLGSSRLPGKVLKEVQGRPLLSYMLERVAQSAYIGQIVVAITNRSQDDPIVDCCHKEGIAVFRGDEDDALDRYYQCASSFHADTIVRLTADCPLMDPKVIDAVVAEYISGNYDYVANTIPPNATFPDGMDVEVFSFAALERAWREARKPSEREHVTFYFWKNTDCFKTHRYDLEESLSHYRLTVDYPEDFEVVSKILSELYPRNANFTMQDIISFLMRHPEIQKNNASIASNQGWEVSLEKDKHTWREI
ncbi:MAG TPA: hypothetical protein EYO39_08330 [Nitrospirales bacterium]|jgi:spore coat polysaccharide biosynthesis protein SpsF|nr:hypothetical protein [Nitrospirales bacterium]